METKIIDLISILDIVKDSELIFNLYSKLNDIENEKCKSKDFEYRYALERMSVREKSLLETGIRKTIKSFLIQQDEKYYWGDDFDSDDFKNRIDTIFNSIPKELILLKRIINKIILTTNKIKENETSKC